MVGKLRDIRRGAAGLMDFAGDVVGAGVLVLVFFAMSKCWSLAQFNFLRAGGFPPIPHTNEQWSYAASAVKVTLLDPQWRPLLLLKVESWALAWVYLVATVALACLFVAGCRWAWIRLRDVIAGAR